MRDLKWKLIAVAALVLAAGVGSLHAQSSNIFIDILNSKLTTSSHTDTTSKPLIDLTKTWNAAGVTFELFKIDVTSTASAAGSKLLDFEVDNADVLTLNKSGDLVLAGGLTSVAATLTTPTVSGVATFNGNVVIGNAASDTVTNLSLWTGLRQDTEIVTGTSKAVTAAMSGRTFIDAPSTSSATTYTIPASAAGAGLRYCFVAAVVTDAANEILLAVDAADSIVGKTHGAENGTGIATSAGTGVKNTTATNVKGDHMCIVSDGVTSWYMTQVAGVWASR